MEVLYSIGIVGHISKLLKLEPHSLYFMARELQRTPVYLDQSHKKRALQGALAVGHQGDTSITSTKR